MKLRPYQHDAVQSVKREWGEGHQKTLLVLPTGTGKTIVFCKLAEDMVRRGERVLILAHRGELLDQAADKMFQATGLKCNVEKADQSAFDGWHRITVGSVQTMMRESRLKNFRPSYYQSIIVDEAHHALADTYQRVLNHFPAAKVLGVTATPDRGDQRSLGEYFSSIAYSYPLPKAIRDGYLCRIVAHTLPLQIDLSAVKVQAGDYQAAGLDTALTPYLAAIVMEMKKHCMDRKTLVFLPLIKTSQYMRDLLNDAGFRACEVNGNSEDRAEVLADFASGKYNVCCNSMLLTEGFDLPSIDCVICLRPTKIRSLYCQLIGRGTRIHPGKENLLLLDFLWMSQRHDLCRPAHLLAENEHQTKAATAKINEAEGPVDLEQMQELAVAGEIHEREEALLKELDRLKRKRGSVTDPLAFAMQIMDSDLQNYVPDGIAASQPADLAKLERLIQAGIDATKITSAGQADAFLAVLDKRSDKATPNTVRKLKSYGFQNVENWSKDSANKMVRRIAINQWRVPAGVSPRDYAPKG
jgi:superfamily II DNA or RNA helicase